MTPQPNFHNSLTCLHRHDAYSLWWRISKGIITYEVRIDDGSCRVFSNYDDAANYYSSLFTPLFRIGQRFINPETHEEWLLAQVDYGQVCAIHLTSGNRQNKPVRVKYVYDITPAELSAAGLKPEWLVTNNENSTAPNQGV